MADEQSKLFTKKASDKLRSPDDLDEYVRVTNPSMWVVLAACASLLIGLFAWGVFGTVTTSVSTTATCAQGELVCFLPAAKASKVHVGDVANVDGKLTKVASIDTMPVSREETREMVGSDYLVSTLVEDDWSYVVRFDGSQGFAEAVPLSASITTERIAPISLIFGNGA